MCRGRGFVSLFSSLVALELKHVVSLCEQLESKSKANVSTAATGAATATASSGVGANKSGGAAHMDAEENRPPRTSAEMTAEADRFRKAMTKF